MHQKISLEEGIPLSAKKKSHQVPILTSHAWVSETQDVTFLSELRTTLIRSIETTKTRLIKRLDVQSEDVVNSGVEGDGVVEKTVFASNGTKPIMLPQFLKSSMSSFVPETSSPSKSSCSGCRLDVPTAPTPRSPT